MPAAARRLGAVRADWSPPLALARSTTVVFAGACPLVGGAPPDARGGWAFVAVRGSVLGAAWDLTARPVAGEVYGSALDGAAVIGEFAGPVVADPPAPGWVGAVDGYETSAALTAVAASLTWLATCSPDPTLLRVGSDVAAMVLAGIVDPSSCVYYPGDDWRWPAARGAERLAALVRRLWRAERTRRGGHLWLLATPSQDGWPWAERARALAFYGCGGALGVMPNAWPGAPAAPPVDTDPDRCPAIEDSCAVCFSAFSDLLPTPAPDSRAPPGRWAEGGVRCPHAICRECDATVQRAHNSRCPICRRARLESALLP